MLNFDKRITPLEAKLQLNTYKAQKNQNLAKVTTHTSQLSVRAYCTQFYPKVTHVITVTILIVLRHL